MAEGGTPVIGPHDEFVDHTCTSCKDRKRNVEALCYCQSCDKYICSSCRDDHSESQRDHVVLETSERSRWGIPQETKLGKQNRRMAKKEEEIRRIILVGKSGNGKSTTGNTLLELEVFKSEQGFASVTQACQLGSRFREDVNREYRIVDTPGLFDTDRTFAKRALEIQKALEICPKPHAFLIVMRLDTRFTEEEQLTIAMLRVIFGERFFEHAVLVFTRGADYNADQELNDVIEKCAAINDLKQKCGSRVVRVENNHRIDITTRNVLTRNVLESVEQVSDGGNKVYLYESLDVHRTCLEQHLKNRKPNAELGHDLAQLCDVLDRQIEKEKKERGEREKKEKKERDEREKKEKKERDKREKKEKEERDERERKEKEERFVKFVVGGVALVATGVGVGLGLGVAIGTATVAGAATATASATATATATAAATSNPATVGVIGIAATEVSTKAMPYIAPVVAVSVKLLSKSLQ